MTFKDYVKLIPQELDAELKLYLTKWRDEVEEINKNLLPLADIFIEGCEGGKRLRGALVKLGFELTGTEYHPEILKPAIAIEIFQTAILAHDDIIDKSDTRRGKPTIYKQLGGDHYAISQTICLGDIGFFLGTKLIAETNFPGDLKNKALHSFTDTMLKTAVGEMLDVKLSKPGEKQVEEDAITIFKLKTARYTITGPLQLGAILGGADQVLLDKLAQFGEDLGIAFQIQDDILGVFGDEQTLGKSVTSDIEEGKNTLLITEATKRATNEQKELLIKYYGAGKIGEDGLNVIREVFEQTGSLDYSKKVATDHIKRAKKIIPDITNDQKYQQILEELADYLINRSK